MGTKVVELRECDRCGKEPAYTWVITGPDGAIREIELCERHGSAVANAYALGRPVTRPAKRSPGRPAKGRGADKPATRAEAESDQPGALPPAPPEPIWR
jgi:hypothetical protein